MTKFLSVLAILLCPFMLRANERAYGWCEQGNQTISVLAYTSSAATPVQRSYPSCTVTVYQSGTSTIATIYSDNSSTPLANPFTATTNGYWFFYAGNGIYDVQFSGSGIPTPFTLGGILLFDIADGGAAGADTQIQLNEAGLFAGDPNLTWNYHTSPEVLTVNGIANIGGPVTITTNAGVSAVSTVGGGNVTSTGGFISTANVFNGFRSTTDGAVIPGISVIQNASTNLSGGYIDIPPITYNPHGQSNPCKDIYGNNVNQPVPLNGIGGFGVHDALLWVGLSPVIPPAGCGAPLPVDPDYGLDTNSYFYALGGLFSGLNSYLSINSFTGGVAAGTVTAGFFYPNGTVTACCGTINSAAGGQYIGGVVLFNASAADPQVGSVQSVINPIPYPPGSYGVAPGMAYYNSVSDCLKIANNALTFNCVSGGGGGAVTQLTAGTGITLSPAGGTGVVQITATGAGGCPTCVLTTGSQIITGIKTFAAAVVFTNNSLIDWIDVNSNQIPVLGLDPSNNVNIGAQAPPNPAGGILSLFSNGVNMIQMNQTTHGFSPVQDAIIFMGDATHNYGALYSYLVSIRSNSGTGAIATIVMDSQNANGRFTDIRAAASVTTSWTMSLPPAAGSNGQVLATDGAGNTSWVPNGAGSGITQIGGPGSDGITPSGSGTQPLTLNTVNTSVGSCGDATHTSQITLNAKGLATACTPILITGGSGITTLNPGGYTGPIVTMQGTTNEVIVTAVGGNTINFATPQPIATTSSVTFQQIFSTTAVTALATGTNVGFSNDNGSWDVLGNGNMNGQIVNATTFQIGATNVVDASRNITGNSLAVTQTVQSTITGTGVAFQAGSGTAQILGNGNFNTAGAIVTAGNISASPLGSAAIIAGGNVEAGAGGAGVFVVGGGFFGLSGTLVASGTCTINVQGGIIYAKTGC